MKKLSARGQKWLKCFHIYSGCVWVGCATVLSIMPYFVNPESDGELYGIQYTLDFIDLFIRYFHFSSTIVIPVSPSFQFPNR